MKAHNWRPGDRVVILDDESHGGRGYGKYYGRTATVLQPNPKNVLVQMDVPDEAKAVGAGRLRCYHGFLFPEGTEVPKPAVKPREFVMPLTLGTVCEYTGPRDPRLNGLWVVVGEQGGKTRITRIGGDGNRYWRIPNGQLREVKVNVEKVPE